MKKTNLFSLIVICLLVCSIKTNVSAQETRDTEEQTFGIQSAGIQVGWYNASMHYWNDTYFKNNNWKNKFEGSMEYGAFLKLHIINNLSVRTSFTYWKECVESDKIQIGGFTGNKKLETTLTSIPIDIIYQPTFLMFENFKPYVGLGGSFLFIQNKYTQIPEGVAQEEQKEQGQDYSGYFIVGIEHDIITNLSIGVEFNYVIGNYVQENKNSTGDISEKNVSLMGPKIGITLAYVF